MLSVLFLAAFEDDAEELVALSKRVWEVDYLFDNRNILAHLSQKMYHFVLFDIEAGGLYPPDVLERIYFEYPSLPIFLFSRQHCFFIEKLSAATAAIAGCFSIPYQFEELAHHISASLEHHRNTLPYNSIKAQLADKQAPLYTKLQGCSPEIQTVRNFILDTAKQNGHVLLYGESGSGKEVVASLIHEYSDKSSGSYLTVNVNCINDELAESLLFGSCKGAYTGAVDREGIFARVHQGTLFLDEIENLSLSLQAKLLRVLETHEYYKLGGKQKYYSDFRLICATNKDLHEMINEGLFRLDLYYRLDVFHITLPPLRTHKQDIELLAVNYLKDTNRSLSDDALALLHTYSWPGNVRELFNCLGRAVFSAKDSETIFPQHFDI